MRPLYWKFFLIFGAVIVGASLIFPKALRKTAVFNSNNIPHAVLLQGLEQSNSLIFAAPQRKPNANIVVNTKFPTELFTTIYSIQNEINANHFGWLIKAPAFSLSVGTRPTKSRVID